MKQGNEELTRKKKGNSPLDQFEQVIESEIDTSDGRQTVFTQFDTSSRERTRVWKAASIKSYRIDKGEN